MDAIIQEQAWIAVVGMFKLYRCMLLCCTENPITVEANATLRLSHARANGDDKYDPRSAITVYYAQVYTHHCVVLVICASQLTL